MVIHGNSKSSASYDNGMKMSTFGKLPLKKLDQPSERNASSFPTHSSRYKTELCRPYEENGNCKYGDKCQFAHGAEELRIMNRHPKYKTEPCRTFHSTGFCPYGPRCHFIHSNESTMDKVFLPAKSSPPKVQLLPESFPFHMPVANQRVFLNEPPPLIRPRKLSSMSDCTIGSSVSDSQCSSISSSPMMSNFPDDSLFTFVNAMSFFTYGKEMEGAGEFSDGQDDCVFRLSPTFPSQEPLGVGQGGLAPTFASREPALVSQNGLTPAFLSQNPVVVNRSGAASPTYFLQRPAVESQNIAVPTFLSHDSVVGRQNSVWVTSSDSVPTFPC